MYRSNDIFWTNDDKENLFLHQYSDLEIEESILKHKKYMKITRIAIFMLLIFYIVGCIIINFNNIVIDLDIHYIVLVFIIGLILKNEGYNRLSYEKRKYYIKVKIKEKLKKEKESYYIGERMWSNHIYYPIIGIDTTTSYETKIYVSKKVYKKNVGDIVEIKVNEKKAMKW